jgi:hypothetical protein
MSKVKNTIIGTLIAGIGFLGYNNLTNNRNCLKCNNGMCKEEAKMIFVAKDAICSDKLLNLEAKDFNLDAYKIPNKVNSCGNYFQSDWKLQGFYIEPKYNVLDNNQNNGLLFSPHWIRTNLNNQTEEAISLPILLSASLSSISTSEMPPLNTPISGIGVLAMPIPNGLFNHNIFQFHGEAVQDTFGKAYISYIALKQILDHCDYLGISGAIVSSGNIGVVEWSTRNGGLVKKTCNQNYFTYRFVGFNDATTSYSLPNDYKLLIKANLKEQGDSSNIQSYEANPRIPTETWAVPCPPMWKPI